MSQKLPTLTVIDQTEGREAALVIRADKTEVLFKGDLAARIRKSLMDMLEGLATIEKGRGKAEIGDNES